MRWILVVTVVIASSGCSVIMVKGPNAKKTTTGGAPACHVRAHAPQAVDGILVGAGVLIAVGGGTAEEPLSARDRTALITGGAVVGALAASSYFLGRSRIKRCRAAGLAFEQANQAVAAAALDSVREVDAPWWCGDDRNDPCYETSADCLQHRKGCAPRTSFSCFTYKNVVIGARDEVCFVSIEVCDRYRVGFAALKDVSGVDGGCAIKRVSDAGLDRHVQNNRLRVEGDVPVVFVDHRFYCFNASGSIRLCMADMARCANYRDAFGAAAQTCSPEDGVACFRTRDVTTGRLDAMCFSLMDHCRKGRTLFATADTAVLDDCFVMRYRP